MLLILLNSKRVKTFSFSCFMFEFYLIKYNYWHAMDATATLKTQNLYMISYFHFDWEKHSNTLVGTMQTNTWDKYCGSHLHEFNKSGILEQRWNLTGTRNIHNNIFLCLNFNACNLPLCLIWFKLTWMQKLLYEGEIKSLQKYFSTAEFLNLS